MLSLTDIQTWQQLTSPYHNVGEIPAKLTTLAEKPSVLLADEIIWEDIYHQNTVYQCTVASVPYLVEICDNSQDIEFQMDVSVSLGIVLLYVQRADLAEIFANSAIPKATITDICQSYKQAFNTYQHLIEKITQENVPSATTSDIWFLIVHLMLAKEYALAEMFTFFNDDEYVFVCPTCEYEYFIQNESDELVVYTDDSYDESIELEEATITCRKYVILDNLANRLKTQTIQPILPFFKKNLVCKKCQRQTPLLEGIINSIN